MTDELRKRLRQIRDGHVADSDADECRRDMCIAAETIRTDRAEFDKQHNDDRELLAAAITKFACGESFTWALQQRLF